MNHIKTTGMLAGMLLAATAMTPALAADMTQDRALKADSEPGNWILHHQNYEGHRFSRLKDINVDNVKGLKLAYTVALGGYQSGGRYPHGNLEGTPIVDDGIAYVTDGWGSVYALDAAATKRGSRILWKMDPGTDRAWAGDVACCGVNNRGVALWKDKVVSIALDGRLFLIEKKTGEMLWEAKVADPAIAETITLAPLVIRDIAITGSAGGEFGIRGWYDAVDLNTGKQAWRTFMIPGPGEPGHETWKGGGNRWKHGGASAWVTPTYDHQLDLVYAGVGNPGPDWDPDYRPGDNKWASSVVAMNAKDGKIKWGFQYTPNDPYDFDEISEHPIIRTKINGQDRTVVTHGARNGFYYTFDAANGSFLHAKQYVDKVTWTAGIDPKTGMPLEYDPKKDTQLYIASMTPSRARPTTDVKCPTTTGGKNWEPSAYNPDLNIMYIPSAEGCNKLTLVVQKDFDDEPGGTVKWRDRFTGGGGVNQGRLTGSIKAVDPVTGEPKFGTAYRYPNWAGLLATAGNLIFTGWPDGEFVALDARNLQEVFTYSTGCGINAPPVTYTVGGKQFVGVLVGSIQKAAILQDSPELKNSATCSMYYAFAL